MATVSKTTKKSNARSSKQPEKRSRIQTENRAVIQQAALDVFSTDGYRGATIDRIADRAGLSKTNLLYYFPSKEEIYRTVIEQTVADWLEPFGKIDPDGDPITEITRYIDAKLAMSAERPEASRLFANEIQRGAPLIHSFLEGPLKDLVDEKAAVFRGWIKSGKLAPVDPHHLIFVIWASTQHYADFDVQVGAILGTKQTGTKTFPSEVSKAIARILVDGIRPRAN